MNPFPRDRGELHVEGVPASRIAAEVGTPCYVYSLAALRAAFHDIDRAFGEAPHLVCYSVKANSNLAVIAAFARAGGGFDIVSGGELFRCLRAGADPSTIVFSGLGKTRDEMRLALDHGIRTFNVESEAELEALDAVAGKTGRKAPIALRVNPDVDPKTHPYISTGMKKSKFGIPISRAPEVYEQARRLPHLEIVGVDCHIGSQLTGLGPFRDALERVRGIVLDLRARGFAIRELDLGGGLGIRYADETPPTAADYARMLLEGIRGLDVTLLIEPGRWLVGNAGIFLTRVLYRKTNEAKRFVVVDGAMNDLIRPALYDAFQAIEPVGDAEGREPEIVDVVGPICESADFLARDRELPSVRAGELLAVRSSGAYGFVMASNYNTRPRAAEVLVDGDRFDVVRARETLDDLVRGESIPESLS